MAKDLQFLDARDWGREINALQREGFTYPDAVANMNRNGKYKDIREQADLNAGMKPEAKYPELAKTAK